MARMFTGDATDAPHINHTCLIMNYGVPVTNVIMAAYFEFYIRDWIKKHNLDPSQANCNGLLIKRVVSLQNHQYSVFSLSKLIIFMVSVESHLLHIFSLFQ